MIQRFQHWGNVLNISVLVLGAVIFLGWTFDITFLKRPIPNLVAMNPATAVAFIFSSLSLLLFTHKKLAGQTPAVAFILAGVVLLIGALKLSGLIFHFDPLVDHLLFSASLENEVAGNSLNRMAPNTAFSFILIAIALILLQSKSYQYRMIAHLLTVITFFVGLLSVLGYTYNVASMQGIFSYIPMAIHTAVGLLIMSIALFMLYPDTAIIKPFVTPYAGGKTARILLPVAVLVPIGVGFLRIYSSNAGWLPQELGTALLILCIIIVFVIYIYNNAVSLNKKDSRRVKAELELRQNERYLKTILNTIGDGVLVLDKDGKHVLLNPAAEKILGISAKGLKPEDLIAGYSFFYPDTTTPYPANELPLGKALKGEESKQVEIYVKSKNMPSGDFITLTSTPLKSSGDSIIGAVGIFQNISDRKKAEEDLKLSNEKFLNLFYSSPVAMVMRSIETGKILDVNEQYELLVGYGKKEMIGKTSLELGMVHNNEISEQIRSTVSTNGSVKNIETTIYNANKEPVNVLVSIEQIPKTKFILSALVNITERKKSEEQLKELNNELESFTYSVSHDLRAPLRIINGYAELINSENESLNDETKRMLGNIMINSKRMGQLIDDLLNFSRLGRKELAKHATDMNDIVNSIVVEELKNNTEKYKITINDLPVCFCDSMLIKQVWQNLISNAIKYSSKSKQPVIEIDGISEKDYTTYSIKDNGIGFDMKYYDKLFGVFQRLHKASEYEGTGVGLALAHRIIAKHGGRIWGESVLNQGTTFYFKIPKL